MRGAIAILIAILVEFGSGLGFSIVICAARPMTAMSHVLSDARDNVAPAPQSLLRASQGAPKLTGTPDDLVSRWALARLDIVSNGSIQADVAYQDFCDWRSEHCFAPLTSQMFGRRFTKVHAGMGGRKVRRRGRAYYEGAALQETPVPPIRVAEPVSAS